LQYFTFEKENVKQQTLAVGNLRLAEHKLRIAQAFKYGGLSSLVKAFFSDASSVC